MDSVGLTRLRRILDLPGRGAHSPVDVRLAGSLPALIRGLTVRPTGDIDFVDEVPEQIRRQRIVLRKIETDFGLKLGHVQSHYLPAHWQIRRQWLGNFGGLHVYLVDEYDFFVSKVAAADRKNWRFIFREPLIMEHAASAETDTGGAAHGSGKTAYQKVPPQSRCSG